MHQRTSWSAAPSLGAACATARSTPGNVSAVTSTWRGSTRNPRTLSIWSVRPARTISPSCVVLARSPVRSSRSPSWSTNLRSVSSWSPRYPRATPSPAMHSSPISPGGHSSRCSSRTVMSTVGIGRPTGTSALDRSAAVISWTAVSAEFSVQPKALKRSPSITSSARSRCADGREVAADDHRPRLGDGVQVTFHEQVEQPDGQVEHRDPLTGDEARELAERRRLLRRDREPAAAQQAGPDVGGGRRERRLRELQEAVVRAGLVAAEVLRDPGDPPLRDHDALGGAGRAGREQDERR